MSAQPTLDDDARAQQDRRLAERLQKLSNFVADLEARLPGWRRELDEVRAELDS